MSRKGSTLGALLLGTLLLAGCGGSGSGAPVRVTIPQGSGLAAVSDTLGAHGIIRWPAGFRLYGRWKGATSALKPGVYEMRRGTGWDVALHKIVSGDVVKVRV
ncbi:MAG: endolytic transglycosylase MltG, partial [Gemmatimonadetes bacterium]|nr:endolytic transglycosylase MltG [Gemmatimonadota bacterium]